MFFIISWYSLAFWRTMDGYYRGEFKKYLDQMDEEIQSSELISNQCTNQRNQLFLGQKTDVCHKQLKYEEKIKMKKIKPNLDHNILV